jgi:hypothetical protein
MKKQKKMGRKGVLYILAAIVSPLNKEEIY